MKKSTRIIIALTVVAVAALAFIAKENKSSSSAVPAGSDVMATPAKSPDANATVTPAAAKAKLPKLLDLGAGKCIPCKMMKPILEDFMANYSNQFTTEFIDVWENREAGRQYGIEAIPTQIFYDAEGKELFRHTGFYGKEDILGKWKEFGIDISETSNVSK